MNVLGMSQLRGVGEEDERGEKECRSTIGGERSRRKGVKGV